MARLRNKVPQRKTLSCGNLAHGFAACGQANKDTLRFMNKANVAIVSAYNDMLSAHQPYETFPAAHPRGGAGAGLGGAVRRRHAGHVRRRDPGAAGHGAEPVLAAT